jgi:flagellar capping protein FliD
MVSAENDILAAIAALTGQITDLKDELTGQYKDLKAEMNQMTNQQGKVT